MSLRLTKPQRRKLTWLLLGKKADAPADAPEAPLSAMLKALLRGEKPADPARVGELVDLLHDLEDQARRAEDEPKAADEADEELPQESDDIVRARLHAASAVKVHVDGACKGNPGPAGVGIAFMDGADNVLHRVARGVGERTNNEAEYLALVAALEEAIKFGLKRLSVFTDSKLLAGHMTGEYAVKTASLLPYVQKAAALRRQLDFFEIHAIPRERNTVADKLSNIGVKMNP
jgi:ribonuclease HI